jgi:hypothetical protein
MNFSKNFRNKNDYYHQKIHKYYQNGIDIHYFHNEFVNKSNHFYKPQDNNQHDSNPPLLSPKYLY